METVLKSSKEIRQEIDQLKAEKDVIETKVSEVKRVAHMGGGFADPHWLANAENAAKRRGRKISLLQVDLGAAVKAEKAVITAMNIKANNQRETTFEREFMKKAKELLPRALYEQVLLMATESTQGD
jgi:hypothetical protein